MGSVAIGTRTFEWDDAKRAKVLKDHQLDLKEVCNAFSGFFLEDYDLDHSSSEDRFRGLGLLGNTVIAVSYCYRGKQIRLITARRATPSEVKIYYSKIFGEPLP